MKFFSPSTWLGSIWTVISGSGVKVSDPKNSSSSDSGEVVSQTAMLQISSAWSCIRLISQSVSCLPLKLYQKTEGGRKEYVDDLSIIISTSPNRLMSATKFRECMILSVLLWGNGYARIIRSGDKIVGLKPLRPEYMSVGITDNDDLVYFYTEDGKKKEYKQDEIFHLRGLSADGYVGLSPITYARQAAGLAISADKAASSTFKNGLKAGGVLKFSNWLKPEQRDLARKSVEALSGSAMSGKTMVLEGGTEYQQITMNPADAELLATRKYQLEEIARWYGVPPWMIGSTEKSTSWGTGMEQQNLGFLTYTLSPYLIEYESAVYNQLLSPIQRAKGVYAEHSLEGLLRADSAGRAAFYSTMTQNGIMTRDEARSKENLPPKKGGDVLTVQSNMIPLDKLGEVTNANNLKNALLDFLGEDSK